MELVVSGLLNIQVGDELGISVITEKAHGGSLMRKMMADSLADLSKYTRNSASHLPERPTLYRPGRTWAQQYYW
jgi:FixJ family two-component response regulator